MSLDSILTSTLAPLASGGAHALVAMQGVEPPYIVWQRIVSTTENTTTGPTDVQNTRVQIDCWARTHAGARSLAAAAVAAMQACELSNVKLSDQDLYDHESKLFRVLMDYSIWSID